jgi:tRNA G18 (ribose-2'-O)-methylase SpoU
VEESSSASTAFLYSGPVPTDPATGPLVEVADLNDHRLNEYRDLNDPAARRRLEAEMAIIVVEGRVAVRQLLNTRLAIRSLLVDDHQVRLAGDIVDAVRARGATVYVVPRYRMADLVGFRMHRGVVAVADRPPDTDPIQLLADVANRPGPLGGLALLAVLEGLNDPENIGALFRNAAAFGVAGILLDPTCADPLYRRSVRVSAGHSLHLPFARLAAWPGGLDRVRTAGFVVCALAPHPVGRAAVDLKGLRAHLTERAPPTVGVALLVGAEGPGLSEAALGASDEVVTISMAPGIDSLNVATAAAVAFDRLAAP